MTATPDQLEILRADRESRLPVRAWSIIVREGLTLTDILTTPDRELLRLRGLGATTLAALREVFPYQPPEPQPAVTAAPQPTRPGCPRDHGPDGWLTVRECAAATGLPYHQIRRACLAGRIQDARTRTRANGDTQWLIPARLGVRDAWCREVGREPRRNVPRLAADAPAPAGFATVTQCADAAGVQRATVLAACRGGRVRGAIAEPARGGLRWLVPERYCDREAWRSLVSGYPGPPDGYCTVKQAAARIGMSPSAVGTALQRNRVPDVIRESVGGRVRQLIPERFCTAEAWERLLGKPGFQPGRDPREKRS